MENELCMVQHVVYKLRCYIYVTKLNHSVENINGGANINLCTFYVICFTSNLNYAFLKFNHLSDAPFRYGQGYGLCCLVILSRLVAIMMRKLLCTP